VNHTRFPKEDHLADRARSDYKVTKGDRVDCNYVERNNFLSVVKIMWNVYGSNVGKMRRFFDVTSGGANTLGIAVLQSVTSYGSE